MKQFFIVAYHTQVNHTFSVTGKNKPQAINKVAKFIRAGKTKLALNTPVMFVEDTLYYGEAPDYKVPVTFN